MSTGEHKDRGASPPGPPPKPSEADGGGSGGQGGVGRDGSTITPLRRLLDGLVDHYLQFLTSGANGGGGGTPGPRGVRALASLLGVLSFNLFAFDQRLSEQDERLSDLLTTTSADGALIDPEVAAEFARLSFLAQPSVLMVVLGYLAANMVAVAVVVAYGLPKAGPIRLLLGGLFLQALTYTVCSTVLG